MPLDKVRDVASVRRKILLGLLSGGAAAGLLSTPAKAAYNPFSRSGQFVNLSGYSTLAAADAAAVAGGFGLNIDVPVTLSAPITLSAKQVKFSGGIITRGTYALTINGLVLADPVPLFEKSSASTGRVSMALNSEIEEAWFAPTCDGTSSQTDDSYCMNDACYAGSRLNGTQATIYFANNTTIKKTINGNPNNGGGIGPTIRGRGPTVAGVYFVGTGFTAFDGSGDGNYAISVPGGFPAIGPSHGNFMAYGVGGTQTTLYLWRFLTYAFSTVLFNPNSGFLGWVMLENSGDGDCEQFYCDNSWLLSTQYTISCRMMAGADPSDGDSFRHIFIGAGVSHDLRTIAGSRTLNVLNSNSLNPNAYDFVDHSTFWADNTCVLYSNAGNLPIRCSAATTFESSGAFNIGDGSTVNTISGTMDGIAINPAYNQATNKFGSFMPLGLQINGGVYGGQSIASNSVLGDDPVFSLIGDQTTGTHYGTFQFLNAVGSVLAKWFLSYVGGAASSVFNVPTAWRHVWTINGTEYAAIEANGVSSIDNQTDATGALTATLTNSPVTGNPTIWVAEKVNGVTKYKPYW